MSGRYFAYGEIQKGDILLSCSDVSYNLRIKPNSKYIVDEVTKRGAYNEIYKIHCLDDPSISHIFYSTSLWYEYFTKVEEEKKVMVEHKKFFVVDEFYDIETSFDNEEDAISHIKEQFEYDYDNNSEYFYIAVPYKKFVCKKTAVEVELNDD